MPNNTKKNSWQKLPDTATKSKTGTKMSIDMELKIETGNISHSEAITRFQIDMAMESEVSLS